MTGVSKTLSGSSILSSPALKEPETLILRAILALFLYPEDQRVSNMVLFHNLPEHLSWEAILRLAASGSNIVVSD